MEANGLAKYLQISREIIARIRNGDLQPGTKVPSENEIIATYGVSNTTARKALQQIELQGYAQRVKGKGTFVRNQDVVRSATRILSFTENMRQAGLEPATRVLHTDKVPPGFSLVVNGRRYSIAGPVYKVHRLRFGDGVPMLLETRYISAALCPGITDLDLSCSLYRIYEEEYQLHLSRIDQMLRSIILDSGSMHFFDLSETTPGFYIEAVTFAGKGTVLELEKSIYRGDKYEFAVSATA